jgi:hypothetical protein
LHGAKPIGANMTDFDFYDPEQYEELTLDSLDTIHKHLHALYDSGSMSNAQKHEAVAINLFIHQALYKKGNCCAVVETCLDDASAEFGFLKGLRTEDLELFSLATKFSRDSKDDECERTIKVMCLKPEPESVDGVPDNKQIILGVVLEPDSTDSHKEYVSAEDIEREAHLWLARRRTRGLMHEEEANNRIEIYESYVALVDFEIGDQLVKKGTWLLMLHVLDEEIWKKVKSGELTGLSIGGFARKESVTNA